MVKIYSPSSTQEFLRCERLWALNKQGWRSSYIGFPDIAMASGTGVHAAAEYLHNEVIVDRGFKPSKSWALDAVDKAAEVAVGDVMAKVAKGATPISRAEDWREKVTDNTKRGGLAYYARFNDIIAQDWTIRGAELAFGAPHRGIEGYCGMADLLFEDDFGLAIADIKTKTPFKVDYYREMFVQQFGFSFQMYQYSWLVNREYGEMPKRFYLIMIEMKTKPVVSLHSYRVDPEYMRYWEHTVTKVWGEMEKVEQGLVVPTIAPDHTAYGKLCPFFEACMTFKLDENLMKQTYVNIKEPK